MRVFITREIPEIAFHLLKKNKITYSYYKPDKPIPRSVLVKKIRKIEALIPLLTETIDKKVIDAMPKCRVIANYAVGFNNIDIQYAKKKNIIVTNTPDVLTESTADLTMMLVLACARRFREGDELIRQHSYKVWKPKLLLGTELKGKTFGILGAGRIGTAVALRAYSFGTGIIYSDTKSNSILERKANAKKVSTNYLLEKSDFVSVHLPLNKNTFHFLNSSRLKLLKKTSIFINTSRGEIIDEKVLINILKKNKIKAAGLDVFENEPDLNPELLKLDNLVVLPHLGSATIEARNAMAELAAKNVINVLKGKRPLTPVY